MPLSIVYSSRSLGGPSCSRYGKHEKGALCFLLLNHSSFLFAEYESGHKQVDGYSVSFITDSYWGCVFKNVWFHLGCQYYWQSGSDLRHSSRLSRAQGIVEKTILHGKDKAWERSTIKCSSHSSDVCVEEHIHMLFHFLYFRHRFLYLPTCNNMLYHEFCYTLMNMPIYSK